MRANKNFLCLIKFNVSCIFALIVVWCLCLIQLAVEQDCESTQYLCSCDYVTKMILAILLNHYLGNTSYFK
jgi:hypothetical protein